MGRQYAAAKRSHALRTARGRKPRSYEALLRHWRRIAADVSGRIEELSVGDDVILAVDIGGTSAPTVLLSAGTHGDEPAAVAAVASLARDGLLDSRFAYRILPCVNPSGFRLGTRGNADGVDVNRSFRGAGSTDEARACIAATAKRSYVATIDLHEDDEATGFYAYDLMRGSHKMLTGPIVSAFDSRGLAVQELTTQFDLGYAGPFDGCTERRRGRVISSFGEQAAAFAGWPLSTYLLAEQTKNALVLESPRNGPFATRVGMHRLAVITAIAEIDAPSRCPPTVTR